LLLQGCQSYTILQRNVFANDDGVTVTVHYGRAERDHVNTFISPATGQEVEFVSRLMIKVDFPNGDVIKAWQCMNTLPYGTMYQTDDRDWKVLVNGFSAVIYRRSEEKQERYYEVYRGVLCSSPDMGEDTKKNDKWREVKQRPREYKR